MHGLSIVPRTMKTKRRKIKNIRRGVDIPKPALESRKTKKSKLFLKELCWTSPKWPATDIQPGKPCIRRGIETLQQTRLDLIPEGHVEFVQSINCRLRTYYKTKLRLQFFSLAQPMRQTLGFWPRAMQDTTKGVLRYIQKDIKSHGHQASWKT